MTILNHNQAQSKSKPAPDTFSFQRAIRDNRTLSWKAKSVAMMYASHGVNNSWSADIAGETGMSDDSVQRGKAELVAAGWLVYAHKGRGGKSGMADAFDLYVVDDPPKAAHSGIEYSTDAESKAAHSGIAKPLTAGLTGEAKPLTAGTDTPNKIDTPEDAPTAAARYESPEPGRLTSSPQKWKRFRQVNGGYWMADQDAVSAARPSGDGFVYLSSEECTDLESRVQGLPRLTRAEKKSAREAGIPSPSYPHRVPDDIIGKVCADAGLAA